MFRRDLIVTATAIALMGWTGVVMAAGYPSVECALNDDKSKMIVAASNVGSSAYACMASCNISIDGQRAFDAFECTFSLAANAAGQSVCARTGAGAGYFTEVSPTRFVCQPR